MRASRALWCRPGRRPQRGSAAGRLLGRGGGSSEGLPPGDATMPAAAASSARNGGRCIHSEACSVQVVDQYLA